MSSSASGSLGQNIANKIAGGLKGGLKSPAQPSRGQRGSTKSTKAKATTSASSAGSNAKPQTTTKKGASSKNLVKSADIIENAPRGLVLSLYKQLLRRSRSFQYTDQEFFARRMHQEFMKRKDVKDNNLYYIRGKWMLENNMGGLL